RMPAAITEEEEYRVATKSQQTECVAVDELEARRGIQHRDQQCGREHEALRVGDLRRAGKNVWIPKRGLTGVKGIGQELDLGLEVGLGVVGDRNLAEEPGSAKDEPARSQCERSNPVAGRRRVVLHGVHTAEGGAKREGSESREIRQNTGALAISIVG